MPRSSKLFKRCDKARLFNVLAFFVVVSLFLFTGCSFDNDSDSQSVNNQSEVQRAIVTKVKDGDSVILRFDNSVEKEARLFGIDAPEYKQAFGRDAKRILSKMIYKQAVLVKSRGIDSYKREIVILSRESDGMNINQSMLELGAAWVYIQYQNDSTWLEIEKRAKDKNLGLWKNKAAISPWKWRKSKNYRKK